MTVKHPLKGTGRRLRSFQYSRSISLDLWTTTLIQDDKNVSNMGEAHGEDVGLLQRAALKRRVGTLFPPAVPVKPAESLTSDTSSMCVEDPAEPNRDVRKAVALALKASSCRAR